jgi:hypothetical protein
MDGPVVVGTDGSATATAAVTEAIELAKGFNQPLQHRDRLSPARDQDGGCAAAVRVAVQPGGWGRLAARAHRSAWSRPARPMSFRRLELTEARSRGALSSRLRR